MKTDKNSRARIEPCGTEALMAAGVESSQDRWTLFQRGSFQSRQRDPLWT